jgi:hypothetical protein
LGPRRRRRRRQSSAYRESKAVNASGPSPRIPVHARLGSPGDSVGAAHSLSLWGVACSCCRGPQSRAADVTTPQSPVPQETSIPRQDNTGGDCCGSIDEEDFAKSSLQPEVASPPLLSSGVDELGAPVGLASEPSSAAHPAGPPAGLATVPSSSVLRLEPDPQVAQVPSPRIVISPRVEAGLPAPSAASPVGLASEPSLAAHLAGPPTGLASAPSSTVLHLEPDPPVTQLRSPPHAEAAAPHLQGAMAALELLDALTGSGVDLVGLSASVAPSPAAPVESSALLRVYTCRHAVAVSGDVPTSSPPATQSTPPGVLFVGKMTKRLGGAVIGLPHMPKRRVKTLPPGTTPRCSRRIAGFGVEPQQQPINVRSRSKRTLMKTLHVVSDAESISPKALDKYAAVFSNPLSSTQIKVLAALFGWTPPAHNEVGPAPISLCH